MSKETEVLSAKEFSEAVTNEKELNTEPRKISLAEGLFRRESQRNQYANYVSGLLYRRGRTANRKTRIYASQTMQKV